MSKLNDLIKELCPDGVEYKRVDDVCRISRGRVMSKSYIASNEGEYPVYSSQTENEGILGTICTFDYDGEYLTWTTDGANAGSVFYRNGKFSITNVCGLLDVQDDVVNTKFLYYVLVVVAPKFVNKGMGNPKLMSNVMGRISIPIPPLPVQCEIVRILDNFTALTSALTSALTAELTAQRKRYSGLLNSLLSFEGRDAQDGVLWKKLGDIAVNLDSRRIAVTKHNRKAGIYPYYGASGIVDYVDDYIFDGDFLLVSEDGANLVARSTPIAFSITGKNWVNNHAHVLKFDNIYLQKYVEIYLNLLDLSPYISKGAQPKLSQTSLKKIILPIPDDSRIRYVVDILDRFDKLCNDLSEGLPAEIAARQKQYEYYRDKLLTFNEKKA